MQTLSLVPALLLCVLAACQPTSDPQTARGGAAGGSPATEPARASAPTADDAFVDRVWKVNESSAVEPGTRYSFLRDGTLVMEAEGDPPGYGTWSYKDGALRMVEDGVAYPVDILRLDADTFEIRSNNPGEAVTILFEPAVGAPLPAAPAAR